jgi:hypothetical protein
MKIKVIFFTVVLWSMFVNPVLGQQISSGSASVQTDEATLKPAIDGIFEAFEKYPLVGLGDRHGLTQEIAFYEQLIRDSRFARDVGNVIVEFGDAAHQDVIDRYVNGEVVPYTEFRKVWINTVGFIPTVSSSYYAHFFFQVRQTNLDLPPEKRIRVWLGEPPINWSEIKNKDEFMKLLGKRDPYPAGIITKNILEQNRKALVIYGSGHFEPLNKEEEAIYARWRKEFPETASQIYRFLQKQIETEYPDAFFVAQVYVGFKDEECTNRFEKRFDDWSFHVLATSVPSTTLERELRECLPKPKSWDPPQAWPEFMQEYIRTHPNDHTLFKGDAILFLDAAAKLTQSPQFDDLFLDEELRQELSRRLEIMIGQPLPPDYLRNIPLVLPYMRDN